LGGRVHGFLNVGKELDIFFLLARILLDRVVKRRVKAKALGLLKVNMSIGLRLIIWMDLAGPPQKLVLKVYRSNVEIHSLGDLLPSTLLFLGLLSCCRLPELLSIVKLYVLLTIVLNGGIILFKKRCQLTILALTVPL
jgi:hypothetical protein